MESSKNLIAAFLFFMVFEECFSLKNYGMNFCFKWIIINIIPKNCLFIVGKSYIFAI